MLILSMLFKVPTVLKIIIFTCALFEGNFEMYGQKLLQPSAVAIEEFGVKQGLSQGMVNCIFQDKEGYIWIATKDGLNRYNGYTIFTFRHKPNEVCSLPDNYCNSIVEDHKGNLWIGTNTKGLFLFDKSTERFYNVPIINSNSNNLCVKELQYRQGNLFIKTMENVNILDLSKLTIHRDKNNVENVPLTFSYDQTPICQKYLSSGIGFNPASWSWGSENELWLSLKDSIHKFKPNGKDLKWHINTLPYSQFGIDKNSKGQVFIFPLAGSLDSMIIAYSNTIILYNNQKNIVYYKKSFSEIQKSPFIKYYKLNDGSIYCIIDNNAYIFNASEKTVEVVSNIHPQNAFGKIINMFIDANGIQWFGSNGNGILKRDPQKKRFRSYKFPHPNSAIISLTHPIKNPFLERLQMLGGFGNVTLDNDGIYWAILKDGKSKLNPLTLYAHDPKSNSTIQLADIPFTYIYPFIYNDSKNRIWLYYHDSLKKNYIAQYNKVNSAVVAAYEIPETIESPEPYISQFYLDNKGIMWLATINGLYAFDEKNKAWKHWKNKPKNIKSISADGVLSICPDPMEPEKYLWIGTEGGGINRFEKATGDCIRYDENDGLPNDVTYCILSDSLNNLWISTNKGLSCFNPIDKKFINYTSDDGLPSDEFNRYTAMYMRNEEIMFGGVNGYVIFNPNEVLKRQPAAPLVFTSISVLNKTINWPNNHKNVDAPVGNCKKLTLLPGQNIFSISFATLEYRNNQKKMYKYRLDGFDDDWSVPSSKNEVTYTNLSPGKYTFYVMGANTDGVWNEEAISMHIFVKPFWYQTLLFKFLALALFAYLLFLFYRYRLQQGLQLEKLRNRIARDLHDEIGSTLSSISIYAAAAKKVSAGNEKAENILSKINTGTSEMMEAMSDIVWAVNTGSGHFYDLVNRVRSFAVQVTEEKNIRLQFTDNKDIPEIGLDMEQRKNIYLICKEAVSNAVKYSGCTLLEVHISSENRKLHIGIHDNGKGMELSNFESETSGNSFGGNGIKNMKYRAAEIDAILNICSKPGNGTRIELIAPYKKS